MPFTVYMPKLSPTMTEGVIAKWHKRPGDRVESGDVLLEIATDKATVEHCALDEGWLRKIVCEDGKKAAVNAPLAIFSEKADESIEGYTPEIISSEPSKETKKPQKPQEEKQEEKTQAEKVVEKKPLKASISPSSAPAATPVHKEAIAHKEPSAQRVLASPLAKKLASQQGLDLESVQGSGPHGRIMSRDLEQAQKLSSTSSPAKPQITEETLTPMRRVIAQRLQESKSLIPHFYIRQEIDAEAVYTMREELKQQKLPYTINDFIIKACANALNKHPQVNSCFQEETQTILRFSRVDIAMAVTIPGGLITPILTDAYNKSLGQLSKEAKQLATRAKEGKLSPEEYQGGSFTISNLGMFGITEMTAIINPPHGAILGIGAITDAPMVKNGAVVPGKKLVLTLSCDHRIIDGAEAAHFMSTLKQLIENPLLFLTE